MAKENLTKTADIQVNPREIDFVTRFARSICGPFLALCVLSGKNLGRSSKARPPP